MLLNFMLAALMAGPLLDVKELGAKGDNFNDDTAVIQGAFDEVNAGRAGTVHFPLGNYKVTKPLVVRPLMEVGTTIRGESGAGGGNGSAIIYDGPEMAAPVLSVAGGFGVRLEKFKIDAKGKAQFGLYLHDDLPRAGMSDVVVRDVSVGGPLPGDSAALPKDAKSAAISIGFNPSGQPDMAQCDSITLDGVTIASSGDEHAAHYGVVVGIANVKNVYLYHPWISGFQYGLMIPTGTGTFNVTGGAGLYCTKADFGMGSGVLSVTGWESEGSARLLSTAGWHSVYASASFDRCAWYGAPADDVVVYFNGALALRGNDLWNNRTATTIPKIACVSPQNGSMMSVISEQNYYHNAKPDGSNIFTSWNGQVSLATANGGAYPPWIRSFGDIGGSEGMMTALPVLPAPAKAPDNPVVVANTVEGDLTVKGSLTVAGPIKGTALDLGGGQHWDATGLYMDANRCWTKDGFYPGIIKWMNQCSLVGGPGEGLRLIGWSGFANGTQRQVWIVPPMRMPPFRKGQ